MNKLILTITVFCSIPYLYGVDGHDYYEKPPRLISTDRKNKYALKVDYNELAPLVKTKYQIMAYHHQLIAVRAELGRDLDQALNITSNPVDMKNKKWSNEELEEIISRSLKEEGN